MHENETPRIREKYKTQGDICLELDGNQKGYYQFMSLMTYQNFTRYRWDDIPMHNTVINQVNTVGNYQSEHLFFRYRKGQLIE